MWHWFLDLFLFTLLILFMLDMLTFLWVNRCYAFFYHLMILTRGYLIFIDIDNFRNFNNHFGHFTGNKILRKVGLILLVESHFRAFRWGGDELAILLPWSSKAKAKELAERVRLRVERTNIEGLKVTITCAVARYEQIVDNLLLQAKRDNSKNRIIVGAGPES